MRNALLLSAALLGGPITGGCASTNDLGPTSLSDLEAQSARSALQRGDTVITIEGDPRDYVGGAIVSVTVGDAPSIVLTFIGRSGSGPGGLLSLAGQFQLPEEIATTLASTGWDFVLRPDDPLSAPALSGQRMNARLDHMEMHADPNGLFFATLHMIETETGDARTVTATGRLTGGCAENTGGAVQHIADPSTVSLCEQVIGSL